MRLSGSVESDVTFDPVDAIADGCAAHVSEARSSNEGQEIPRRYTACR